MKTGDQMNKKPKSQVKHVLDNACRPSVWRAAVDSLLLSYWSCTVQGIAVDLRDIQSARMKMCGIREISRYWLKKMT